MGMRILVAGLKQRAVYWSSPVPDGVGGHTFDAPVVIKVRWEEKNEVFKNPSGKEEMSSGIVFSAIDLDLGGYLFLGLLGDLDSNPVDPEKINDTAEIRRFDKLPALRRKDEFLRKSFVV